MIRTVWSKGGKMAAGETTWVITTKQRATYGKSPKLVHKDTFLPKPHVEEKKRVIGKDVIKAKQWALQEKKNEFRQTLELIREQRPELYEDLLQTEKVQEALRTGPPPPPRAKSSKWYQHMMRLEEKMAKETTVFNELRLLKPRKDTNQEERVTEQKRIPSLLMSHLRGIPEQGKLLPPKPPKGDPSLISARMLKMGRKVQEALQLEMDLKCHLDLLDENTNTVPQLVEVKMSPDLRRATVFWQPHSLLGELNQYEVALWQKKLEANQARLKRHLALRIRARFVPELVFRHRSIAEEQEEEEEEEE